MKTGVVKVVLVSLSLTAASALHAQQTTTERAQQRAQEGLQTVQQGLYAGINVSQIDYKASGVSTAKPRMIGISVGSRVHQMFAIEGRIGTGFSDDSATALGVPVTVDVDRLAGIYGKAIFPIAENFEIYGLLGYTHSKVEVRGTGIRETDSEDGPAYGIGGEVGIGPNTYLNIEWARILEGSDYNGDAMSLGVRFTF